MTTTKQYIEFMKKKPIMRYLDIAGDIAILILATPMMIVLRIINGKNFSIQTQCNEERRLLDLRYGKGGNGK